MELLSKTIHNKNLRKVLVNLALIVPFVIYCLPLIMTGNKIIPGDADYAIQLAEAFRKTVIYYHQMPMWNAWVDGGIPLFANIQFGLISLQSPLILMFGSAAGMKISILAYQIITFFGFKKLFTSYFKTENLTAILLAYIISFSSFFTYRVIAGHFTFLLLAYVPWLLLFFFNRRAKLSWLWFSLILSLMIWSSPHYVTIMSIFVIGVWYIYEKIPQIIDSTDKKHRDSLIAELRKDLMFFIKILSLTLLLCIYRMLFVRDFLNDYPRPTLGNEGYTGVLTGIRAIWGPEPYTHPGVLNSGLGWVEASAYIGIGTFFVISLIFFVWLRKHKTKGTSKLFTYSPIILLALAATFFILGMGNIGLFSPYKAIHALPVFNSMRVATRWLMYTSIFLIFFIAAYKGKPFRKAINIFLACAAIELFIIGFPSISRAYFTRIQQYRPPTASFDQVYKYQLPRPLYAPDKNFQSVYAYDENLYETTLNNYGQVIAGDALVDTRKSNTTIRCGANQPGCPFVSTNAMVAKWSPNKIVLKRLAPGAIEINMNPGKDWAVNGQYVFKKYKVAEPLKKFIINDKSNSITIEYLPKYSIEALFN